MIDSTVIDHLDAEQLRALAKRLVGKMMNWRARQDESGHWVEIVSVTA